MKLRLLLSLVLFCLSHFELQASEKVQIKGGFGYELNSVFGAFANLKSAPARIVVHPFEERVQLETRNGKLVGIIGEKKVSDLNGAKLLFDSVRARLKKKYKADFIDYNVLQSPTNVGKPTTFSHCSYQHEGRSVSLELVSKNLKYVLMLTYRVHLSAKEKNSLEGL